eukprot:Protomagalhaensia_wolfi_Nauph_80__1378@NODE_1824_length_1320_cov_316_071038_g1424_i0_p1_GENE_NODE_1824_length_1320_cov_316_071038_g1424_i0NODE_1824_length_1320_cov_316_071038_g1424_i0_p1_ORF_typecomplete_len263_score49_95_NODE_1824_length_1320_cov_316_071038_g1424_i02911079
MKSSVATPSEATQSSLPLAAALVAELTCYSLEVTSYGGVGLVESPMLEQQVNAAWGFLNGVYAEGKDTAVLCTEQGILYTFKFGDMRSKDVPYGLIQFIPVPECSPEAREFKLRLLHNRLKENYIRRVVPMKINDNFRFEPFPTGAATKDQASLPNPTHNSFKFKGHPGFHLVAVQRNATDLCAATEYGTVTMDDYTTITREFGLVKTMDYFDLNVGVFYTQEEGWEQILRNFKGFSLADRTQCCQKEPFGFESSDPPQALD